MGEGGYGHLEVEAGDAAEGFVDVEDFLGDFFCIAYDECAGGAEECVELAASDGRPAALLADLGEGFSVAGEELVGGLGGGVRYVAKHVQADFELLGGVAGAGPGFAIEIDEGGGSDGARHR